MRQAARLGIKEGESCRVRWAISPGARVVGGERRRCAEVESGGRLQGRPAVRCVKPAEVEVECETRDRRRPTSRQAWGCIHR